MILAGGLTLKDLDLIFHTLLEVLPQYHPTDAQNSLAIASDISERQRKLHLHEEFIREKALKARQLKAQCAAANAHSKALDEERRILMETYREITGDNRRKETANQLYANELPPLEELNRKAREENASTLRQIAALENAVAANDAERAQLARLALGTEQKLAVLSQQAAVTRERAKLAQEHERRLIAEITANEEAIASYNQPTANAYLEARLSATAKQIEALNEMLASALASHPTQPEELVKALTTNSQLTGKALEIYLRPAAS